MPLTRPLIALDTATEFCSVAVLHAGQLHERSTEAGQAHSQHLLPLLLRLLDDQGLTVRDCGAIAFGAGPGSFTGLRIACGVAQGLAYGLDLPVLAVGNLEAIAFLARASHPAARRIGVAIDARMQEAYWAAYAVEGTHVREISPPALAPFSELADSFSGLLIDTAAGNAFDIVSTPSSWHLLAGIRATAGAIAHLGAQQLEAGHGLAPHLAAPLYVRDRVALTIDERRAAQARP